MNKKRYTAVSDIPHWTIHDNQTGRDLFPTPTGNRDAYRPYCDEQTAHDIAQFLSRWHILRKTGWVKEERGDDD